LHPSRKIWLSCCLVNLEANYKAVRGMEEGKSS
jgi:hypothetical protein